MLSDTERDALEDIRDNIARAMRFVDGFDLDAFLADDKTFYAATRCLEIISEASRRLPSAFKETVSRNPLETGCRFRQHLPTHLRERSRAANLEDDSRSPAPASRRRGRRVARVIYGYARVSTDALDSGDELVIAEWDRATRSMWDGLPIIKAHDRRQSLDQGSRPQLDQPRNPDGARLHTPRFQERGRSVRRATVRPSERRALPPPTSQDRFDALAADHVQLHEGGAGRTLCAALQFRHMING